MPAGPPLSSRITAALLRWARLLRLSRVVPLLLVAGAVTVVTVGAPMVSGAVTSFTDPVALESTATSAGAPPATTGTGGAATADAGVGAGARAGSCAAGCLPRAAAASGNAGSSVLYAAHDGSSAWSSCASRFGASAAHGGHAMAVREAAATTRNVHRPRRSPA